jgi:hypothetical protein
MEKTGETVNIDPAAEISFDTLTSVSARAAATVNDAATHIKPPIRRQIAELVITSIFICLSPIQLIT